MSPEAKDLRPLLLKEVVNGLDLWARDSLRRAYAGLPALVPRIPFLGPLPVPPPPPLWVPGIGFMPLGDLVEALAPPLSQQEEVYLQTLGQLTSSALGSPSHQQNIFSSIVTCVDVRRITDRGILWRFVTRIETTMPYLCIGVPSM